MQGVCSCIPRAFSRPPLYNKILPIHPQPSLYSSASVPGRGGTPPGPLLPLETDRAHLKGRLASATKEEREQGEVQLPIPRYPLPGPSGPRGRHTQRPASPVWGTRGARRTSAGGVPHLSYATVVRVSDEALHGNSDPPDRTGTRPAPVAPTRRIIAARHIQPYDEQPD